MRGDTLELGLQNGVSINPTEEIVYRVSVKDLRGFRLSGSGDVGLQNIDTDELAIEIGGSGTITATGRAGAQTVTIAGQGDYMGEALESSSAVIDISGSGSALVYANQSLDVTITGSGNVEYLGEAAVKQDISGSGAVRKR